MLQRGTTRRSRLSFSLDFDAIQDGEEQIEDAERATFEWIFENPENTDLPWSNFSEWLQAGESLYWVTGKAGSGKSTLMKHLFHHQRTREALLHWAGETPLTVAGFFF